MNSIHDGKPPENLFLSEALDILGKDCLYENRGDAGNLVSALTEIVPVEAFSYLENEVMSGNYTEEELHKIFFFNGNGKCNFCQGPLTFEHYGEKHKGKPGNWEVDHDKPSAKGGSNCISNLMPAHVTCNRSNQDDLK